MSFFDRETLEKIQGLRFFVYLRKSSEDNEDKQMRSIEGQLEDIQELILARFSIKPIYIYQEKKSAFKTGRPFFDEMLGRIEAGDADGVIVWHPNRIARNYQDGGRFVQLMSDGLIKMLVTC
jgi:DNA invertase Pin-like site-specific DNA recombinase